MISSAITSTYNKEESKVPEESTDHNKREQCDDVLESLMDTSKELMKSDNGQQFLSAEKCDQESMGVDLIKPEIKEQSVITNKQSITGDGEKMNIKTQDEFQCTKCEKKYKTFNHLNTHTISKHTAKKYTCETCNYQSSFLSHLLKHRQKKHPGNK